MWEVRATQDDYMDVIGRAKQDARAEQLPRCCPQSPQGFSKRLQNMFCAQLNDSNLRLLAGPACGGLRRVSEGAPVWRPDRVAPFLSPTCFLSIQFTAIQKIHE